VSRWRAHLIAVVGGGAFALSAPPTDFHIAVLVGLAALFVASRGVERPRSVALVAALWATSAGLVGLRFIPAVIVRFTDLGVALGGLALVLLAIIQSGTWAFGLALSRIVERRTGLDPHLAFGLGVVVAVSFVFVIAWTPAALLSPWPALVQLAELFGEKGVSFFLALAVALLCSPIARKLEGQSASNGRRRWVAPALGLALLGLMAAHGAWRMKEVARVHQELPTMRIGVVQAAVGARMRWEPGARDTILRRLRRLTAESERGGAELTLWPEAAYPYVLDHAAGRMPRGYRAILGKWVKGPVLFGLLTRATDGSGSFNATTVVEPEGLVQLPQAKMELLWFGETVPLGEHLPFLRKLFSRAGGLIPGREVVLLRAGAARMGILNCYEDTLPAVSRKIAKKRPNLLVNVTNDAWFGPTAEPELHLRLSVLRAIETRRDLVRAVNLGVPAWIDSSGTIRERGSADAEGVMFVSPALNDMSPTLYSRAGDIPLWLGLALAIADAFYRSRRRRAGTITEPGP
jgi:apolipoprotein N-acyltransferase